MVVCLPIGYSFRTPLVGYEATLLNDASWRGDNGARADIQRDRQSLEGFTRLLETPYQTAKCEKPVGHVAVNNRQGTFIFP